MKNLGMVRNLDKIGRICLPKELRKTLNMKDGDSLEIFLEGDTINIKKIICEDDNPKCLFCGSEDNLYEKNGITMCVGCVKNFCEHLKLN